MKKKSQRRKSKVKQSVDGVAEIKVDNGEPEPQETPDLKKPRKKESVKSKVSQDYSVATLYAYKRARERQEHDVQALHNRLEYLKKQDKKLWNNIKQQGEHALRTLEVKAVKEKRRQLKRKG
jgi:hypothetical protein